MPNPSQNDQLIVTSYVEKAVRESAHQLKDLLDSGLLTRLAEAKLRIVRRQLNDNANLLQILNQPSENVLLQDDCQRVESELQSERRSLERVESLLLQHVRNTPSEHERLLVQSALSELRNVLQKSG